MENKQMNWTIRRARLQDSTVIANCNIAMALETENRPLDPDIIVQGVRHLMNRPEMGFYLVGENSDGIQGCLMITFEWTDWRNGLFWWIQSVYVTPSSRRKGLFRALHDHVIQLAGTDEWVRGIRLYVEKNNLAACSTYRALGMTETSYRLYETVFR